MEEVIKKIIEIEHEAQNLVNNGIEQKEQMQKNTRDELRAIEADILERSEKEIEKLNGINRRETDEKLARIHEHTALRIQQMSEVIGKNKETWESEIFNRIVGR